MPSVDAAIFRQLCGHFATGVVVITTRTAEGTPVGMTANSFTSVSLEPPLVSVNVDRATDMHRHLESAEHFVLNILEARQEALSRRFADAGRDRFAGVGYTRTDQGIPVLDGTLATIECERRQAFPAGDHTIVIGAVVGGAVRDGRPLLYYRGGYYDLPRS